jgi:hypothetical protein
VETGGHDAVRRVEGLLDTVTVVDVNVDVENTLVVAEKLEDTEDNVLSLAKNVLALPTHH